MFNFLEMTSVQTAYGLSPEGDSAVSGRKSGVDGIETIDAGR
jgi:hypothetical protein